MVVAQIPKTIGFIYALVMIGIIAYPLVFRTMATENRLAAPCHFSIPGISIF